MGGHIPFPTYERICSGVNGYIEIIEIIYDPITISYETLLQVFFTVHDPTSINKQGNDSGPQYKSIIFGTSEELKVATNSIQKLNEAGIFTMPIVTELRLLEVFYIAEDYHQNYYKNNPKQPYCRYVIDAKIQKLKNEFASYLKDV